jgi:hypothetical protein
MIFGGGPWVTRRCPWPLVVRRWPLPLTPDRAAGAVFPACRSPPWARKKIRRGGALRLEIQAPHICPFEEAGGVFSSLVQLRCGTAPDKGLILAICAVLLISSDRQAVYCMRAAVTARPDVAEAARFLSSHLQHPCEVHLKAALRGV